MKVVAIVPIKLNNERLPGKNLLPMADGQSLLSRLLRTLSQVQRIDEVIVYCSDPVIEPMVTEAGGRFLRRSPDLDLPTAKSNEILGAFAADVSADVYALVHATSPFLSTSSIDLGLAKILDEGHDSALSVTRLQTFVWVDGKPFNYDPTAIPRTQDLDPIMVETSAFYMFRREVLAETGRRIGHTPYLVEVSKIEAMDIDDPPDLVLANAVITAGLAVGQAPAYE